MEKFMNMETTLNIFTFTIAGFKYQVNLLTLNFNIK